MKNNLFILVSLVQIFLIVGSIPSSSYLIGNSIYLEENIIENKEGSFEKLANLGIDFLIGLLEIKQIGSVSAQSSWCCVDAGENGPSCQDISPGSSRCVNPTPTSCSQTAECKVGTCIDRDQGICTANSPKQACEESELRWEQRNINEISECRQGCCILGDNANFATATQCDALSESLGIGSDFRLGLTEQECLAITLTIARGACVLPGGDCRVVKGVECQQIGGEFYEKLLCTSLSLDTVCKPTEETSCSTESGNYDVYFKDSCGNLANVYDSGKTESQDFEYWDRIQDPVCDENNPQACGICNYPSQSRCLEVGETDSKPSLGNYMCRNLKCTDENGGLRLNGESWCVYESKIGEGKDVVGSEHWLKYCENGEVKIDDTQQKYRGEICAEKKIDLDVPIDGKEKFSIAQYRPNFWPQCFNIAIEDPSNDATIEQRNAEQCDAHPDCRVSTTTIAGQFSFKTCVPEYPKGFDLSLNADNSDEEGICGFATQTCTVVEEKKLRGLGTEWECIANCGCTQEHGGDVFATEMNQFCTALGDCGGKANVAGKYERNYRIGGDIATGNPDLEEDYKGNANPDSSDESPLYIFNPDSAGSYEDVVTNVVNPQEEESWWSQNAATGIAVGGLVAGVSAGGALGTTVAVEIAAGATAYSALAAFFFWAAIAIVVIFVIIELAGIGDIREKTVSFTCDLWVPPTGGDNCSQCHEGNLPCTQYKCNALGTGCALINIETEEPLCIYQFAGDVIPPSIDLGSVKINVNGEEIESSYISQDGQNGFEVSEEYCIESFSEVEISFRTENDNGDDDHAQCMYDYNSVDLGFEDISEAYNIGDVAYIVNHSFNEIVSTNHEGIKDLTEGVEENIGRLEMYLRCQDPGGNYNNAEFKMNLKCITSKDTTSPRIIEFNPPSPWYVQFESTSSVLNLELNEISQCKYDFNEGVNYSEMAYDFVCNPLTEGGSLRGSCSANIEGLDQDENNLYIKCSDGNDNVNVQDVLYVFYSTKDALRIDSIQPQGEILGKDEYFQLELEVTTAGGSGNGDSTCNYEFENHPEYSPSELSETGTKTHKQVFSSLPNGRYDIIVTCTDSAGNTAESHSVFDLKIDRSSPKVVRAFNENNKLKLITDEDAQCYYSNDKIKGCGFKLDENVTSMSSSFVREHSAEWDGGKTYFVKCKDIFEHVNTGCAIKVNPT